MTQTSTIEIGANWRSIRLPDGGFRESSSSRTTVYSCYPRFMEKPCRKSGLTKEEQTETEIRSLVDSLYALCKLQKDRDAIDVALDFFDDRLIENRYDECEHTLRRIECHKMASSVLVSILGITIRAKKRLRARASFYERTLVQITRQKGTKYALKVLSKYR